MRSFLPFIALWRLKDGREKRVHVPSDVFDAGSGYDSVVIAKKVWHQGWIKGGG